MAKGIRFWSTAGLVLLAAVGIGVWRLRGHAAGGTSADEDMSLDKNRIAVMYFENRGMADSLGYIADGLTEALIHEMSGVKGLQVISRNGVAPFRHSTVTTDSIGRALKSGTLVQGTVAQSDDRLRLSVSLVNAANGEEIASQTCWSGHERGSSPCRTTWRKRCRCSCGSGWGRKSSSMRSGWAPATPRRGSCCSAAGGLSKDLEPLLAPGTRPRPRGSSRRPIRCLAQAEQLDPDWTAAPIERGWLAYHQTDLISTFDKHVLLDLDRARAGAC